MPFDAFQQTGSIPVEGLLDRLPPERLEEFYLAVRRYDRLHLSAEENAEIDVAEAHEAAVLAVAAMLEGDSETFPEVFTGGGPLMKIIPLAWVRNARDSLPMDLYRRAMLCSAWPAAWFAPLVAAIRNGCTTLTTTAMSTGTPASPPTRRTRSSARRS